MAVRLVCRKCGKRLKLPAGVAVRSAKCPKCLAPVDLTAAREVSAYQSAAVDPDATRKSPAPPDVPRPVVPRPPITVTKPLPAPKPASPPKPAAPPKPVPLLGADDPRPSPKPLELPEDSRPPLVTTPPPNTDEILSLDDDPAEDAPVEVVPFRVPVRVLADSLTTVVGPCDAVILPHGLFLEHEPMKPFLYIPPGVRVDSPAPGELTVALPEGRSVTLRFLGRSARPLACDTQAFLAGAGPVPVAADYRRKWWMLWSALIFALGLAGGPVVLSQTAELGAEFGLLVGAGFALAGFLLNAGIVLFSRRGVFVQVLVMAGACVLVTGVFLFGASAYLAGRQKAGEQPKPEPPPAAAQPAPQQPLPLDPKPSEPKPPEPKPSEPKPGHSIEVGTADVTALAVTPNGKTLAIGGADGTTHLWPIDPPAAEPPLPGPKADGPVTRVQFDTKGRFLFVSTATGVIAAPPGEKNAVLAKLPGALVAVASEPYGDRIRFAAVRGNVVAHRIVRESFVLKPPKGDKGDKGDKYALPGAGDEITPLGVVNDPAKPDGLTFLAWAPGGRLFAGQTDGTLTIWSLAMKPEAPSHDPKAAVEAWAECPASGAFATGDKQGNVGIWSSKGGKPTMIRDLLPRPITGLAFSASGARLAAIDDAGGLAIWDVTAGKRIHRVNRPAPVKAIAFGPGEDVIVLAAGRTVEVWALAALK